jgi:hypothetical protein
MKYRVIKALYGIECMLMGNVAIVQGGAVACFVAAIAYIWS